MIILKQYSNIYILNYDRPDGKRVLIANGNIYTANRLFYVPTYVRHFGRFGKLPISMSILRVPTPTFAALSRCARFTSVIFFRLTTLQSLELTSSNVYIDYPVIIDNNNTRVVIVSCLWSNTLNHAVIIQFS